MDYVILVEKPDAVNAFSKAFGGQQGTFHGKSYQIVYAAGHCLENVEPKEMVSDPDESQKVGSWSLDNLPWDTSHFSWAYRPIAGRTKYLQNIKKVLKNEKPQAVIIATDCDPTGEGDMIGWEIIDYVRWHGAVGRLWFDGDDVKGLQEGFDKIYIIDDKMKDPHYMRGLARQRFDYCSMQFSRAATLLLQQKQYRATLRIGRLKSVIISYIYNQIYAHDHYIRKPYYMLHYKDEQDHVYKMKDDPHYDSQDQVPINDAKESQVVSVTHQKRLVMPPKMISLSDITSQLSHQFKTKQVLDTYESMYQKHYVSYPRTEDDKVREEQYQELVDNSEQIAKVVGIDPKLLTHKTPRPQYIAKKSDHGANRPGSKVPANLDEIRAIYGECGAAIYDYVARCTLATMMDDAVYDRIVAKLDNGAYWQYDALKEPKWKDILGNKADVVSDPVIPSEGMIAKPFIDEGANKRTGMPTETRLNNYLRRVNVGTGATRASTLAQLVDKEVKNNKGKLTLTPLGNINALMINGAMIATPEATKKLDTLFSKIAKNGNIQQSETVALRMLERDEDVFKKNADSFENNADATTKQKYHYVAKNDDNSFKVTFNGKTARIKRTWGKIQLTDDDVEHLQNGNAIIKTGKKGDRTYQVKLQVGNCKTSDGHAYIGLVSEFVQNDDDLFEVNYQGQTYKINKMFVGAKLSDDEIQRLQNGETITITRKSKKTGKPYNANVTVGENTYRGKKSIGLVMSFDNKK